jgi:biopolymer transport protein TolR
MALRNKHAGLAGQNEANITPLADVTTTLIVVFMITMPAMMWNGFQVNQAEAGSESSVVTPTEAADEDLLTIEVLPTGITLNGAFVAVDSLESILTSELAGRTDKTVVIAPDDAVVLGLVVEVLDIAKASGAESLAMLNRIGS